MKKPLKITLTLSITIIMLLGFVLPLNPAGYWYQQFLPSQPGGSLRDIYFVDSLLGFAVTDSSILKTTNSGDNWTVKLNGFNIFQRIQFLNADTGFACAGNNKLLKTTDRGENWTTIIPSSIFPFDMAVLSVDTIWLVSTNPLTGGVFRTTNGGGSWQNQFSGGSQNPNKIYMYNARIGFMSNSSAASPNLYKTTNGGVNWSINLPGEYFYSIFFIDSLTGWKTMLENVSADTSVKKTTNGGINWIKQKLPTGGIILTSQITKLSLINKDTIYGAGGQAFYGAGVFRAMLYRTTNGGNTWKFQIPDTAYGIPSLGYIQFINKNTGWAYSSARGIHTTNGGDTSWLTPLEQVSTEVPKQYRLYQNYPNPFNPVTNFRFHITGYGLVKLKIYDITGKEVTTLIDEELRAGEYKTDWYASDAASGVYFYKLTVSNGKEVFTETKRMILLK